MENTQHAKIIKSNELMCTKVNTKLSIQSELFPVFSVANASYTDEKQFAKKNQVSCAPSLLRHSHDDLKFHHKRSMCHHRRKIIRVRQGQCNRRLRENILKMFNQSKRIFTINDVTVTKMWDV